MFAWWLGDQELEGIFGPALLAMMQTKAYVVDGQLNSQYFEDIPSKFWSEGLPLENFSSAWDAVGCVLAHSQAGELFTEDRAPLPDALKQKLLAHLNPLRADALPAKVKKSHLDIAHYQTQSLRALLLSNDDPSRVFSYSPVETAWSDYYAIKTLWLKAPQDLVDWLSTTCSSPIDEPSRKHALVVQAFQHICLALGFKQEQDQIDALLKSNVSIGAWVGIHAFKNAINSGSFGTNALSKIALIEPYSEQQTVLCWLINEANHDKSDVKPHLIAKLTQSIAAPLTDKQLKDILQPVRGRLGRLHHFTPWILESLLLPMLELKVVDAAQVAREWLGDLITHWEKALNGEHLHFTFEGDGAFTDEIATLVYQLTQPDQNQVREELWKTLKLLARKIRKPMSAQVDWSAYICAHKINLWLYALSRRIAALIHNDENQPLQEILEESKSLIDRLSDCDLETFTDRELLTYFRGDPYQIKAHPLLKKSTTQ